MTADSVVNICPQQIDVLNIVLEHIAQGMIVVGPDYRTLAFNRHFTEMFQPPPGTVTIGADFRELLKLWTNENGQNQKTLENAIHHLDNPEPFEFEFSQQVNGETRWCLLTHNPLPSKGFIRTYTDITEKKQAVEELRKSEQRFRSFVENINDVLFVLTPAGIFSYVSPQWKTAFGYELIETIGQPFAPFVHPDDVAGCFSFLQLVFETGSRQSGVEYRVKCKDGTYLWYKANASLIQDPVSGVLSLVGIGRDITERKQSEEALLALKNELLEQNQELQATKEKLQVQINDYATSQKLLIESEFRFKALSNATFGGIVIHDQGRILDCNQALSDMTGFSFEELIGMDGLKLIVPEYLGLVLQHMQSGFDQPYEVVGLRKDGSQFPLEVIGKTIPYQGRTVRVNEFRDITGRKRTEEALRESEAYYRLLTENVSDVVWKLDHNYRFTYISPADEHLRGYKAEEVIGHHIFELFTEEGIATVQRISRQRQEAEQSGVWTDRPTIFEAQHRCKDGSWLWAEINSTPERDANGTVIGFHGITRDITERKEHEKERLKIDKLESLGVLAGGIAHDFNNILTGIMGNISFAQMFLDAAHKSYKPLIEAEKASLRAGELAHQLLTFARGGEPVKKVVSLQHLVSEAVSLVLHGSNVKGSFDIPDSIYAIEADEGQISQIFHNIIINASQAMPGGGTLTVTARNETLQDNNTLALPSGSYIMITFADQGCGISDDDQKRIFDPYFTTKAAGSGLGLASVHSIVNRHGGHIGVSSLTGTGTTFTIHLPSIGKTYANHQTVSTKPSAGRQSGGSILVLDDEQMIRDMISEMLTYLGYQVITCENGSESITLYKTAMEAGAPFSAVIMDLTIPGGMGGKEAAEQILAFDNKACLIVSSGYSNDPIMSEYESYGFCAAVVKPYTIKALSKMLSSVLPS